MSDSLKNNRKANNKKSRPTPRAIPRTLYLFCPAYAMHGPLDRIKYFASAHWLCKQLNWELVPSPLLEKYMGNGAWLPLHERIADLKMGLRHDLLWACRGGYGSIELVKTIITAKLSHKPGLIGYSDITALHTAFAKRGWHRRFYGPTHNELTSAGRAHDTIVRLIQGHGLHISSAQESGTQVQYAGRAQGRLFPACLSVLASLCGTPAAISLSGHVLAIEDVKIHPFLLATYLEQLFLSGCLRGVRALIGGTFTHQEDADYWGPSPDDILRQWGERLKIPVLSRFPFGHMRDSYVLPAQRKTTLIAEKSGRWSLTIAQED
jgi:muramoyltetrapeptide carboxypeptidase